MSRVKILLCAAAMPLVTGCATAVKGKSDEIFLETPNCAETLQCTATNKKGKWNFTAPGAVEFKKSDDPLTIECTGKGETFTETITPTRGDWAWGNVVLGGIIGGVVDANTDAHWDTPNSISVERKLCEGEKL